MTCPASDVSVSAQMPRPIRSNMFCLFLKERALMLQLAVIQKMKPLLLRPGFWQRRDNTD